MNTMHRIKFFLIVALMVGSVAHQAQAQTAADYSLLPETMTTPPDITPSILFIVDISGSMKEDNMGNIVGAHNPNSRSYSVRAVIRSLLNDNVGKINAGLMTFGPNGPSDQGGSKVINCNDYADCGSTVERRRRNLTGKGVLISNMGPLNPAKRNEINTALATEPELPSLADGDSWDYNTYFEDGEDLYYGTTLISTGRTPLTGSIESAGRYLVTSNLAANEIRLVRPGTSVTYPAPADTTLPPECQANTFVFLVTDGLPTTSRTGGNVNISDEIGNVEGAAATLRTAGVDTLLFGYQLTEDAAARMNGIGQAGSGQDAFISNDPATLKAQIGSAIAEITQARGSSSGISVVANSSEGAGMTVQALYEPKLTKTVAGIEQSVDWTGRLSGYFLDEFGYLREDGNDNGQLDDYSTDTAFRLEFNPSTQEVDVERLTIANAGTPLFSESVLETVSVEDLDPIWEASEVLGSYSDNAKYGSTQRPYGTTASDAAGYRHIISWMADDPNDVANLDQGTQLQFVFNNNPTAASINAKNYLMFDPAAGTVPQQKDEVNNIIRFIRGEEGITGYRNRTLDGTKYLLGDIVHSNSVQVGAPRSNFDLQNDASYAAFKETYENRRRVVYVGANDGLLHAFNGGFWNSSAKQFTTISSADPAATGHQLGAELWAYAPMNLLPHLKFLADPTYNSAHHIAYMDGPVQSFDVRAWDNGDSVHINGWGTIIVAGMRLGGGDYPNLDWNAISLADSPYTAKSAYVIIDVTDPEREPQIIAEVTHDDLGFTLSQPTVVKTDCDSDRVCDWHLIVGSGPDQLASVTSSITQTPKISRFRLDDGNWGLEVEASTEVYTEVENTPGFVGDLVASDWNSDYQDDVVYFGTIKGSQATALGGIHRFRLASNDVRQMMNTNRPVPYRPLLRRQSGKEWVLFGTGRFYTIDDADNTQQNYFYGLIEPRDSSGDLEFNDVITTTDLANVSGIEVLAADGSLSSPVGTATTFSELRASILDEGSNPDRGWYKRLDAASPTRKTSASPLAFRNFLFYTDYAPPAADANLCANEFGESYLNVVDVTTGTASFFRDPSFDGPLGLDGFDIETSVRLGDGYANQSYLFTGPDPSTGRPRLVIKTPLSTGEIHDTTLSLPPSQGGRTSWKELEIQ